MTNKHVHLNVSMKSAGTAYLLWFFLGGFLMHRIYTKGFLNWLLCLAVALVTVGIGAIVIVLWDLFRIPAQIRAANAEAFAEVDRAMMGSV